MPDILRTRSCGLNAREKWLCVRMIPQAAADEADLESRFPPISSNGQLTISTKNEVSAEDDGGGECTGEMGGNCKLRRGSVDNGPALKSNAHTRPGGKPCCFCWCCCCTCSWLHQRRNKCLAVKAGDSGCRNRNESAISDQGNCDTEPRADHRSVDLAEFFGGGSKKEKKRGKKAKKTGDEEDTKVTLDEIRCWGKSFDKLMKSAAGRNVFREFLRCEYSEENILFWLACEELKREGNPDVIEEKARFIYEDYISILSPKEVSLDSRVREVVNRNMVSPTPHTFDEAQLQIYTLMHRDSYPRFVNSPLYKKLAQINNNTDANEAANALEAQRST